MIRKIIQIDEAVCNGCGACAAACHEGAIGIVDGKAKLLRDDYCDGLGDCLPACPMDAIHFVEREAAAYDAAAVQANMRKKQAQSEPAHTGGCPGSRMRSIRREEDAQPQTAAPQPSQLGQWPCQIKLIGCPKLDAVDYTDKLTQIIRGNDIQSVTIVRMEVPCCGGLEHAAREALRASGKFLPWQVVTISIDGKILDC